jgi:hypothetical protein
LRQPAREVHARSNLLTRDEKLLIADALSGIQFGQSDDKEFVRLFCADPDTLTDRTFFCENTQQEEELCELPCSGLEFQIDNEMCHNRLDAKWHVDGPQLLKKIAALSPANRERLVHDLIDLETYLRQI